MSMPVKLIISGKMKAPDKTENTCGAVDRKKRQQ